MVEIKRNEKKITLSVFGKYNLLENRALQSPNPTDIMASFLFPLKYFMAVQTFLNDFACPLSLIQIG